MGPAPLTWFNRLDEVLERLDGEDEIEDDAVGGTVIVDDDGTVVGCC